MRGKVVTCETPHPTKEWAKHGAPRPSLNEDIFFNFFDPEAKALNAYEPGQEYILQVVTELKAHSWLTASSGVPQARAADGPGQSVWHASVDVYVLR